MRDIFEFDWQDSGNDLEHIIEERIYGHDECLFKKCCEKYKKKKNKYCKKCPRR